MAAQFVVIVSFAVLLGACVIPTAYPFGSAPRWRPKPLRLRVGVSALLAALVFPLIAPALPERLIPWSFRPVAQAAEVLNAPEYIDVSDWQNMVKLFIAVARSGHEYRPGHAALREKLEKRFAGLKRFL